MKRRTFRQLRSKAEAGLHHHVYVVLLNASAGKLRKVRAENPKRDPKKPCVYCQVGGIADTLTQTNGHFYRVFCQNRVAQVTVLSVCRHDRPDAGGTVCQPQSGHQGGSGGEAPWHPASAGTLPALKPDAVRGGGGNGNGFGGRSAPGGLHRRGGPLSRTIVRAMPGVGTPTQNSIVRVFGPFLADT